MIKSTFDYIIYHFCTLGEQGNLNCFYIEKNKCNENILAVNTMYNMLNIAKNVNIFPLLAATVYSTLFILLFGIQLL